MKYLILILIEKIFFFSTKKELQIFLQKIEISAFLSKLITSNDIMKVSFLLLICDSALQKLPELIIPFIREGILSFLEKISLEDNLKNLEILPLNKELGRNLKIDYKQIYQIEANENKLLQEEENWGYGFENMLGEELKPEEMELSNKNKINLIYY